ncbi:hypothetical protein RRG08_048519 [Elysia crispata]|uniref:Uncharacterized protein n=1 Tax=Elysia crispata TaxID=231223 RepID=A0AAE1B4M7_9GAST|nr:hypothetical protein RRG08_048519 [Elysia crispata]
MYEPLLELYKSIPSLARVLPVCMCSDFAGLPTGTISLEHGSSESTGCGLEIIWLSMSFDNPWSENTFLGRYDFRLSKLQLDISTCYFIQVTKFQKQRGAVNRQRQGSEPRLSIWTECDGRGIICWLRQICEERLTQFDISEAVLPS